MFVVVLTDGSITTTPEISNDGDEIAVLVATLGVFSTYEGTPEKLSRAPDINPSNIVENPDSGLTVFSRISSPRERASHDDIHTKRMTEKIAIVRASAILFLV